MADDAATEYGDNDAPMAPAITFDDCVDMVESLYTVMENQLHDIENMIHDLQIYEYMRNVYNQIAPESERLTKAQSGGAKTTVDFETLWSKHALRTRTYPLPAGLKDVLDQLEKGPEGNDVVQLYADIEYVQRAILTSIDKIKAGSITKVMRAFYNGTYKRHMERLRAAANAWADEVNVEPGKARACVLLLWCLRENTIPDKRTETALTALASAPNAKPRLIALTTIRYSAIRSVSDDQMAVLREKAASRDIANDLKWGAVSDLQAHELLRMACGQNLAVLEALLNMYSARLSEAQQAEYRRICVTPVSTGGRRRRPRIQGRRA